LWPALTTIVSSLFRWGMLNPWQPTDPESWRFVGLDNYGQTLTSGDFWNATLNTAIWVVVFPALVLAISLAVSLLLWNVGRGAGLIRSVFILPMTISLAAAGVIWGFIYNPDPNKGVLNAVLSTVGLQDASLDWGWLQLHLGRWLSNPGVIHIGALDIRLTNVFVILPAVWAFAGFGVITFTAGLTSVPAELTDAARVDGASTLQTIRHVVIPQLRPSMIVVAVVSVIFALRTFDIVFVTTGGGPAQDTQVLALLLWQQAFVFLDTPLGGVAAAVAVLMSVTLVIAALPYLKSMVRSPR
ncbi:MAG: sugar ABC transporter permease, partial [Pseudonocardia sp.]|nr:sugar ABC transporter permease [Pseudonocardia sp.]